MVTCTLCGNEEIERPIICQATPKKLNADGFEVADFDHSTQVPFGRYCWTHKRQACLAMVRKIAEVRQ